MIAWRYDQKTLSLSLIIYTSDIYIGSYDCLYFPSKMCMQAILLNDTCMNNYIS